MIAVTADDLEPLLRRRDRCATCCDLFVLMFTSERCAAKSCERGGIAPKAIPMELRVITAAGGEVRDCCSAGRWMSDGLGGGVVALSVV